MRPASGRSSPASNRNNVVFPAPLSPTITRVSPPPADRATSSENSPRRLVISALNRATSRADAGGPGGEAQRQQHRERENHEQQRQRDRGVEMGLQRDRKSTRLNSSH